MRNSNIIKQNKTVIQTYQAMYETHKRS